MVVWIVTRGIMRGWGVASGSLLRQRGDVERALTPARKDLARRAAAFVHALPDLTDVFMHVVPSPDVSNDAATGTAVRNHFFMELATRCSSHYRPRRSSRVTPCSRQRSSFGRRSAPGSP
jgi:hypothetical protein